METIICLFGSDADATQALDAIYEAGFEDLDTEVINTVPEEWLAVPGGSLTANLAPGVVTTSVSDYSLAADLDLEDEEAHFLAQSLAGGSVVVIIDVDEDDADLVETILMDHNARFLEEDEDED